MLRLDDKGQIDNVILSSGERLRAILALLF